MFFTKYVNVKKRTFSVPQSLIPYASQSMPCFSGFLVKAAILDSWDILVSSERERETLQETWQDIWQEGGAQDVTHTPNPIFNPTELPPLKLSLVGVWHNIKT